MSISISSQSYGKARVCLSYITRHDDRHDFIQLAVEIALEGDFDAAYVEGDNSKVVPTDTMKNSVYGIARKHGVESIEAFARNLASHFYDSFDHVDSATVSVAESLWQRIESSGSPHPHGFVGGGSEENTCTVTQSSAGTRMKSGLRGLQVLKTTNSGFEGFLQDQFTTLKETSDRIFATTITTEWPCEKLDHDWTAQRTKIRGLLLGAFVARYSPSVQKTLHEMADVVLTECPEVNEISLNMPNQHHLLADIAKLNLENKNDIFVPTPEPFGVISATISRDK
jgi:urate oxidase